MCIHICTFFYDCDDYMKKKDEKRFCLLEKANKNLEGAVQFVLL